MYVHVALFKWKENVTKEKINKILNDIRQLKDKIEGIKDILCGENFSPHSEGFTHAIVVIAEDGDALQRYRDHPGHRGLAFEIAKMEEYGIGVDFKA